MHECVDEKRGQQVITHLCVRRQPCAIHHARSVSMQRDNFDAHLHHFCATEHSYRTKLVSAIDIAHFINVLSFQPWIIHMLFAQSSSPVSNLPSYINDVGVSARGHSALRSALDAPDQVCESGLISLVDVHTVIHLGVQSQGPALFAAVRSCLAKYLQCDVRYLLHCPSGSKKMRKDWRTYMCSAADYASTHMCAFLS